VSGRDLKKLISVQEYQQDGHGNCKCNSGSHNKCCTELDRCTSQVSKLFGGVFIIENAIEISAPLNKVMAGLMDLWWRM